MGIIREELEAWLGNVPPLSDPPGTERPAAVLVPIVWNPKSGRDEILLTKRTTRVATHKGQISFPGGMWEDGDGDLRTTALRETEEEIGLSRECIQVVGRLPMVLTRGALPIVPWVGLVSIFADLKLNDHEVEKTLWLPVERLLAEGLKAVTVAVGPVSVASIGIEVEGELVWGATARILEELHVVLKRGLP